jgi:hypothetical protein
MGNRTLRPRPGGTPLDLPLSEGLGISATELEANFKIILNALFDLAVLPEQFLPAIFTIELLLGTT